MAYSFASASSQYLSAALTVAGQPCTLSAWFMSTNNASISDVLTINNPAFADFYTRILFRGDISGDPIQFWGFSAANPANTSPQSTSGLTQDVWGQTTGTAATTTSRSIYLNGGNSATNTTVENGYVAATQTVIGAFLRNVGSDNFCNGRIAEAAIWNVELTSGEINSLAKGFRPTRIRPQSLVFYAPLVRSLQDVRGGLTITNNNSATVANHPRVYA